MAKNAKGKSSVNAAQARDILDLWIENAKVGLGLGKKFAPECFTEYEPKLLKSIQAMLDAGEEFDKEAQKHTMRVAKDTGRVCRMFTLGRMVSVDTFGTVFTFMQDNHPVCPAGGGGGGWCEP